jgi:hypothetical protein
LHRPSMQLEKRERGRRPSMDGGAWFARNLRGEKPKGVACVAIRLNLGPAEGSLMVY